MADKRRPVDIVVASVVEDLCLAFGDLPGFQGADMTLRHKAGAGQGSPVLRLHVAPARAEEIADSVPRVFGDLPLVVTRAAYGISPMGEPKLRPAQHVTGASGCGADPFGRGSSGQVTLMACERERGRIGVLTGLATVGGGAGPTGSALFRSGPDAALGGAPGVPIAHVTATCFDRSGAAAFAVLDPTQPWLPIERPENLAVTSLTRPALGETLRAASDVVRVDGIGIYRIRDALGGFADIEGFRTRSDSALPSGALVYDDQRCSAVGLATACTRGAGGAWLTVNCEVARVMAELELRIAGYDDLIDAETRPAKRRRAEPAANLDAMLGDPRDIAAAEGEDAAIAVMLEPNRRPDIATMIWPALRSALRAAGAPQPRGITDRIERLDLTGLARATLAASINASAELSGMGLCGVAASDFRFCVTYDQVCERIVDILTGQLD